MRAVTQQEMKAIDRYAIEGIGIPSVVLMENAALKLLRNIDTSRYHSPLIVCGIGNNGGDGLALLRHLHGWDIQTDVFVVDDPEKGSPDFKVQAKIIQNLGIPLQRIQTLEDLENLERAIDRCDLIIDAIFGIGLDRTVSGIYEYAINMMNDARRPILSVDIPSGMDADTGRAMGVCIHADKVITFQFMKKGLENNPFLKGEVVVESIGIPKKAVEIILGKGHW